MSDIFNIITEYASQNYYDTYTIHNPDLSETRDDIILLQEKLFSSGISDEQQKMINELLKAHDEMCLESNKKVYIKGLKDCVVILKELGIL